MVDTVHGGYCYYKNTQDLREFQDALQKALVMPQNCPLR